MDSKPKRKLKREFETLFSSDVTRLIAQTGFKFPPNVTDTMFEDEAGVPVAVKGTPAKTPTAEMVTDQHSFLVEKLRGHIKNAKATGAGFPSKAAFLRSLRNGRGMDRQSLQRWEKRLPTLTPGHVGIIEAAIDKL